MKSTFHATWILGAILTGAIEPSCFADVSAADVFSLTAGNEWRFEGPAAGKYTSVTFDYVGNLSTPTLTTTLPNNASTTSSLSIEESLTEITLGLVNFKGKIMGYPLELTLNTPAPLLWYSVNPQDQIPIHVGDVRTPSNLIGTATVFLGSQSKQFKNLSVQVQAAVLGRDIITLPTASFGSPAARVAAYRFRTKITAMNQSFANYTWFVPHLGIVAQGSGASLAKKPHLVGFTLNTGAITESVDTDEDGIRDWQEILINGTNPNSPDSDGDLALDNVDLCPTDSQDACSDVHEGSTKPASKLIVKAAGASDSINATLTGCEGLADAIVKLPPNAVASNVKVTVGETQYSGVQDTDFTVRKGIYSLPILLGSNDKPIARVNLNPGIDTVDLAGAKLALNLPGVEAGTVVEGNKPLTLKVEVGKWSCISSAAWKVAASTVKMTRLVMPKP